MRWRKNHQWKGCPVHQGSMKAGDDLQRFVSDNAKSSMPVNHSQSRPGKRGFPLSISARMHPTLQMSIARVYSLNVNMTSGARYHLRKRKQSAMFNFHDQRTYRVATYSVIKVLVSSTFGGGRAERASPKSHSCRQYAKKLW